MLQAIYEARGMYNKAYLQTLYEGKWATERSALEEKRMPPEEITTIKYVYLDCLLLVNNVDTSVSLSGKLLSLSDLCG